MNPNLVRQFRVFLELRVLIRLSFQKLGHANTRDPAKFAGNILLLHNLFDFVDRSHTCVPGSFRMLFSEIAYQFMQPFVCDTGKMGCGMAAIACREPLTFKQDDTQAGSL